jgi:hypothetical protein
LFLNFHADDTKKVLDKESMITAVGAVTKMEMGYKLASRTLSVPRATFRDHVKNHEKRARDQVELPQGKKSVLQPEMETELLLYYLEI